MPHAKRVNHFDLMTVIEKAAEFNPGQVWNGMDQ